MKAAEFKNVGFSHREGITCFRDLSFSLSAGVSTALLGPNGAGKSTLMALLLGYLKPSAGDVFLFQRPLGSYSRRELGSLAGFVSQTGGVSFNYSVEDYVLLGRAAKVSVLGVPGKEDREAAREALERAGIYSLAQRNVMELSAGELQLASIARCLAQEARLVILDEPTSHLDPARTSAVVSLIQRLQNRGLTVFFSTHDPHLSRLCAREVILLKQGALVAAGLSGEVLTTANLRELYDTAFIETVIDNIRIPLADYRGI